MINKEIHKEAMQQRLWPLKASQAYQKLTLIRSMFQGSDEMKGSKVQNSYQE